MRFPESLTRLKGGKTIERIGRRIGRRIEKTARKVERMEKGNPGKRAEWGEMTGKAVKIELRYGQRTALMPKWKCLE